MGSLGPLHKVAMPRTVYERLGNGVGLPKELQNAFLARQPPTLYSRFSPKLSRSAG